MTLLERLDLVQADGTSSWRLPSVLRGIPQTLLLAALFVSQLLALRWMSQGHYLALLEAPNGTVLLWAHTASKLLVAGLMAIAALVFVRRGLREPVLSSRPARFSLVGLNLFAFVALTLLLQNLPTGSMSDPRLSLPLIQAYAGAISLLSIFALSSTALILPSSLRLRRTAIGGAALILAALLHTDHMHSVVSISRDLIEGTALDLSLWFYGLSGRTLPSIDYSSANPIMSSAGFAIAVGGSCSGYQGMISAFILLGAYIGLERNALRLDRAIILCVVAVGGTFVLNAFRIAVLFYIGEEISPEIAVNGFHSQFGTLALLTTTAMAILLMELSPFRKDGGHSMNWPTTAVLDQERILALMIPLAVYLLTAMIAGLFTGTFNWLYPLPVLVGAAALWHFRHRIWTELERAPSLTSLFVGLAVYSFWIALIPEDQERSTVLQEALSSAPVWLAAIWVVFRVLGSSVVVPLVEELAFRGGLIRLLEAMLPSWMGSSTIAVFTLTISSIAFGLLHADILAATLAGMAYGILFLWRRALSDAVVAHAVTNFLICLHVLGLGAWSYW